MSGAIAVSTCSTIIGCTSKTLPMETDVADVSPEHSTAELAVTKLGQTSIFMDDFETNPFVTGWTDTPSDPNKNQVDHKNASWLGSSEVGAGRSFSVGSGAWYGPALQSAALRYVELSLKAKSAGAGFYGLGFFDNNAEKLPASGYCQVEPSIDGKLYRTIFAVPREADHVRAFFQAGKDPIMIDDVSILSIDDQYALKHIDESYAAMRPVNELALGDEHWQFLRSTRDILAKGGELSIVCIGDSLANDLAQSQFHLLIERAWPGSSVRLHNEPANNGRPRDFLNSAQFAKRVLQHQPDLVLFGGISTQEVDLPELALLSRRLKTSQVELVVFTGTMLMPDYWFEFRDPPTRQKQYRQALIEVSEEEKFAVFDLGGAWEDYVLAGNEAVESFRRDSHHANDRGKQIFGRLMARWLLP